MTTSITSKQKTTVKRILSKVQNANVNANVAKPVSKQSHKKPESKYTVYINEPNNNRINKNKKITLP